jgi:hypothetical protein
VFRFFYRVLFNLSRFIRSFDYIYLALQIRGEIRSTKIFHIMLISTSSALSVVLFRHLSLFINRYARLKTNQTHIIAMSITNIQTRKTKKQKIVDEEDDEPTALALLFTEQWKDIFEEHILPKLENGNELKFLKMSFRDARDAVERSKIKVEEKFNILEFTSISQMEFAWDNYHWDENGIFGTQKYFCMRVARMNKLEYLVWLREVKNCDWCSWTIYWAAKQGNLAMVKYCVDNGCPMDAGACTWAAGEGHLDVLKYLHENDCPWSSRACSWAYENNHVDCLKYLIEQKCPKWERFDSTHADYDPYYNSDDEEEDESELYDSES